MSLNYFSDLRDQSQNLHSRRHEAAETRYQAGLSAFARAADAGFRDKQALRTAFDHWIEALKTHRQHTGAQIGLGYLFMIMGDSRTAISYFKSVQRQQPNHADAARFIEQLQRPSSVSSPPPRTTLPPASALSEDEQNARYDRAEALLDFQLRRVQAEPLLEPCLTPAEYQRQQVLVREQKGCLAELDALCAPLEADMDLAPLQQKRYLLERECQRFEAVAQLSSRYLDLLQRIQHSQQITEAQLELLQQGHSAEPARMIESLLDTCDQLADELDALDSRGHAVSRLEKAYEQLAQRISSLQDKLDEQI